MTVVVILGILSYVCECFIYLHPFPWDAMHARRILCGIAIIFATFSAMAFLLMHFSAWSIMYALVSGHRTVNLLRIAEARMNNLYLRRVTRRTTLLLLATSLALIFTYAISTAAHVPVDVWLGLLIGAQLVAGLVLVYSSIRTLKKTTAPQHSSNLSTNKLPSVTIAVPARNETQDLEDCLQSLILSDYPKLEILVLDDCSQLRQTPAIIKDFAHAGVRFLQGEPPHDTWSAKNHAYAQLSREASGDILLFVGVDVRVEPRTVRELVETMIERNKRMMSIVPLRYRAQNIQISLSQATRYMWELAPPRRFFNRPAVFSTCWMIYAKDLKKFGGFAAVSRMVVPEAYFARRATIYKDSYGLIRSNPGMGLYSAKSLAAQRSTAIRVRYPALHRRPENVLLITLLELALIIASPVIAIAGWFGYVHPWFGVVAAISTVLYITCYSIVVVSTKVNSWYVAPFLTFPAIFVDVVMMHVSMWQYEFTKVMWKGRNVCLPVMHVYPRLPEI